MATRWIPLMRDFVKKVELVLRDERYSILGFTGLGILLFVTSVSREW